MIGTYLRKSYHCVNVQLIQLIHNPGRQGAVLAAVARHTVTPWDKLPSSASGGIGGGSSRDASCGVDGFARMSQWASSGRLVHVGSVLASRSTRMLDLTGMQARSCLETYEVYGGGSGACNRVGMVGKNENNS